MVKQTRVTLDEKLAQTGGVCKWCMEMNCWTHGQIEKPDPAEKAKTKKTWTQKTPGITKASTEKYQRVGLDQKLAETGGVCKWCMQGACWTHGQIERPPPKKNNNFQKGGGGMNFQKGGGGMKFQQGGGGMKILQGGGMNMLQGGQPNRTQMIMAAQQLLAAAAKM
eukprot:TRINITY_DN75337_c0_g1_i1.p1 TRINITY_DN75337_c0_g1~~TRINITY_DN75337_c0_g1_i1.p1  ORF type:complete len:188 (-),score=44.54 TRINITY_DN75337_c0_g1_i1:210-707(-)